MPAYSYLETDEFSGGIVFARSNIEARRLGANLLNMDEIGGMQVTRRKDLDKYEGTGVPARELVAEGWWFECHGCGMRINDCALDDAGLPISGIVGTQGRSIYCCHTCRMEALAEDAASKAYGEAFLEMLRDLVRARFPDIEHHFDEHRSHVFIPRYSDPIVVAEAEVNFSFPGMKRGPAALRYRHEPPHYHGGQLIGPVKPEFYCCNGDREAFEALAARRSTEAA